jgi:hypothetical protein
MADNDQSKIHYDDFVSAVQPDPAKPEATIMLAGFVGHGADGQIRIYPDPTLAKWYDVAEGDVVHSMPIADSKLGGSYIWVRESAQIKPGSAAAAAPAEAPQALAAVPNQNLNQPTPQTHCFICPPPSLPCQVPTQICQIQTEHCTPATICTLHGQCPPPQTALIHCPTQPVVCDIPPQSLRCATHPVVCDIPPHQTLATICTQIGCLTQPVVCGILPPSINCTQQGCGPVGQQPGGIQPQAMAALQPTPSAVNQCGVPPPFSQHICPTPSAVQQCGVPLSQNICPTPTALPQCATPPFTQHICPTPSAVQQCGWLQPTPSAVQQCGGVHPTLATLCTQPHLCPQAAAQPQAMAAAPQGAAAFQPTPSAVNQCGVAQAFSQHICATPSAVHQCGQPTLATLCTQPHLCPPPVASVAVICATPTATQPGFCHPTANIACLQTANVVCAQTGVAACVPSVACTPTPNGVFTPFGR